MSRVITGYHTLEDRDNADEVEINGPFICTRNNAWLSDGYYFWDSDLELAHEWGRVGYQLRRKQYLICQGEILNDDFIFDLVGSVLHQKTFIAMMDLLLEQLPNGVEPRMVDVLDFLRSNGAFPFNAIRAADKHLKSREVSFGGKRGEYAILNQRTQICLLNKKNLILPSFRIIFPLKYVR